MRAAQQNASQALSTAEATAGQLQQRVTVASTQVGDQLSAAPGQIREVGHRLAKSTLTRANAVGDFSRTHPLLIGTAAAGLVASTVGLALLYRRYAGELDAASTLVEANDEEAHREAIGDAALVPQEFPNALDDLPVTAGAGQ